MHSEMVVKILPTGSTFADTLCLSLLSIEHFECGHLILKSLPLEAIGKS